MAGHQNVLRVMVACVALLGITAIVPAAAEDEPAPAGGPLEVGPWTAAANASGRSHGSEQGVDFEWVGSIPAQFQFDVFDSGSVDGTWSHQGSGVLRMDGVVEGQALSAVFPMTISGGGTVSGSNTRLALDGNSRTAGTMTGTAAGQSISIPIDNTHPIPTLFVTVRSTMCDEAYGEWDYTIEDVFTDQGLRASFGGYWVAFRDTDEVHDHVDELLDRAAMGGDELPDFTSMTPLLANAAELLWRYNDFVDDFPNWRLSDVIDAMEWAEDLINGLRNLTDCDLQLFGEDLVEVFMSGLTLVIQQLVINILRVDDVPSQAWQQLSQIAARTGAIGAGALDASAAAAAEAALIEAGSEILTEHLDDEGYIAVNDDTKRVMSTGAAMGWSFDVDGEIYSARDTFEAYLEAGGTE